MRKTVIILVLFFIPVLVFSSVNVRMHFSDEIAYTSYNRIWVSPSEHYFSVNSILNNFSINTDMDVMITTSFGLGLGLGFGYQYSIFDYNRFVTVPKSINYSLIAGVVYDINQFRFALSAILRPSLQIDRSNWISQLGGMFDLTYCFDNKLNLIVSYKYLYNYNMVSSAVSLGLGYAFGGKR